MGMWGVPGSCSTPDGYVQCHCHVAHVMGMWGVPASCSTHDGYVRCQCHVVHVMGMWGVAGSYSTHKNQNNFMALALSFHLYVHSREGTKDFQVSWSTLAYSAQSQVPDDQSSCPVCGSFRNDDISSKPSPCLCSHGVLYPSSSHALSTTKQSSILASPLETAHLLETLSHMSHYQLKACTTSDRKALSHATQRREDTPASALASCLTNQDD